MATVTIRPNEDLYDNGTIATSSGSVAYVLIDETALDTGDYITTSAQVSARISFGYTSTELSNATINSITIWVNLINDNLLLACIGENDYTSGAGLFSSGSDNYKYLAFAKNPLTDSDWTLSEIEDLDFGIVYGFSSLKTPVKVYQLYIVVDYTAGGGETPSKKFLFKK